MWRPASLLTQILIWLLYIDEALTRTKVSLMFLSDLFRFEINLLRRINVEGALHSSYLSQPPWPAVVYFLDALASLDFKLSVSESVIHLFQLAHLRVFQSYFLSIQRHGWAMISRKELDFHVEFFPNWIIIQDWKALTLSTLASRRGWRRRKSGLRRRWRREPGWSAWRRTGTT